LDDVEVRKGGDEASVLQFHELEVELASGDRRELVALAETLEKELRLVPSHLSKYDRGLEAAGLSRAPAPKTAFTAKDPVIALVRRRLRDQFQALLLEEKRAWEGIQPEGVHQMRVASRRLRVALQVFRDWLPAGKVKVLNRELKWITSALGEVRDLDVYREAVARRAEASGLDLAAYDAYLARRWERAREELIHTLSSYRYAAFKTRFAKFLEQSFWKKRAKHSRRKESARAVAERMLKPALRGFLKDGGKISPDDPDERLHELRKEGKHLRYLLEIFAPVFRGKLRTFLQPVKGIQTVLGDHQDTSVALDWIAVYREEGQAASGSEALEKLEAEIRQERHALRQRFPEVWETFEEQARPKRLIKVVRETARS
jgi:CHAD domain-containing protein